MSAETVVIGKIYTADGGDFAEAMAISDGKTVFVGSERDAMRLCSKDTTIIRRSGLIVPGMTEGHAHVTCASEALFGVALGRAEDPEEYIFRIREYLAAHPSASAVIGSGYDNSVFGDQGPTAKLLDTVSSDIPIIMIASDHHSRWVNSKALALAGITKDTADPLNGKIMRFPDGEPTGWLKESAMSLVNAVTPKLSPDEYAEAIKYYQGIALSYGVTNIFEPMFDSLRDYRARAEGYKIADEAGELYLTCRLGYSLEEGDDLDAAIKAMLAIRRDLSSCGNVKLDTAKFFADGVVECHTAYLRDDYSDAAGDRGAPTISRGTLTKYARLALENGFNVHTHVIGDGAVDLALDAYDDAVSDIGKIDIMPRLALTHLQIVAPDQIKRMKKLGVYAVTNPYWHYTSEAYYEKLEKPYLGEKRAAGEYPMRSLVDAGIPVSQASDFPVTVPPNTMHALHLMVTRKDPEDASAPALNAAECVSRREALDILTIGGAKQLGLDGTKGSIEVGKDADFVVLDKDVFDIDDDALCSVEVLETYVGGVLRYKKIK